MVLALTGCGDPAPLISAPAITVTTRTLRTLPPGTESPATTAPADTVPVPPGEGVPAITGPGATGPTPTSPGGSPPAPTALVPGGERPSAAFCQQVRRYTQVVNQLNAGPAGAELRQLVVDVTSAIEAAAAAAPSAVKPDVTLMAQAHRRFLSGLEAADFDPAALDPAAAASLQSSAYLAARPRVRDYNRANC
ncbi:MAG: hypothetical protein ACT4OS_02795 [Acidimicrobiales bacterium]